MRTYKKKSIGILLAGILAALSVTGCGSPKGGTSPDSAARSGEKVSNTSQAMGRYLEEELPLPEGLDEVQDLILLDDGSYEIAGCNNSTMQYLRYKMTDGASWTDVGVPEAINSGELNANGESLTLCLAPAGDILVTASSYDEEQGSLTETFTYFDPQGQKQLLDIQVPQDKNPGNNVYKARFTQSGQLFVQDYGRVNYEIDKATGAILKTYDADGADILLSAPAGNRWVIVTADQVLCYDISTGEELPKDSVLSQQIMERKESLGDSSGSSEGILFAGDQKDGLFYCDRRGIYYHAAGGSVCEQMVDGQLVSLSNPTTMLQKLLKSEDDSFLVEAVDENMVCRLLKYTYSADTPAVPATELKVYSLEDHTFLRQAINQFQHVNPDIYVNLEIGVTGKDAVTREDALRTLNTDILAGNGPDVLILDGMPLNSYIEKNMLLDISDILQKIRETDGVFENVANTFQKDEKVYAIPAKFAVPIIVGDADTAASGSTLKAFADRAEAMRAKDGEKNVYERIDEKILLQELFAADSAGWLQEDGSISEVELQNYLTQAKRIYGTNSHEGEDASNSYTYDTFQEYTSDSISNYILDTVLGGSQCAFGLLSSMQSYATVTSATDSKPDAGFTMGLFGGEVNSHSFVPSEIVGISSTTGEEKAARSFIQTMLSSDTATSGSYTFSTNKKAYENAKVQPWGDDEGNVGGYSVSSQDGTQLEFMIRWPSQEHMDQLTKMLESLNRPCINDGIILDIVLEQGGAYLKGEQSLEDTSKTILQKMNLYLAE
ncbi:MAG: extracellular solute-binding protein [Lachnospiraceae bacterium]|nr:extracellular solute-binding protein [Lachnospiraceae bacterium]